MATKRVVAYTAPDVFSAPVYAASGAVLVDGMVVGLDSNGDCRPGDYRVLQGAVVAYGFATHGAVQRDAKGNALNTLPRISFTRQGNVDGLTDHLGAPLTPGKPYYLMTGGTITKTAPAASGGGNTEQVVGLALTTSELQILIGSPVVR